MQALSRFLVGRTDWTIRVMVWAISALVGFTTRTPMKKSGVTKVIYLVVVFLSGMMVGKTLVGVGRPPKEFVPDTVTVFMNDRHETIRVFRYEGGPERITRTRPEGPAYQITMEAGGERRYVLGTPVTEGSP
jgi:hypothetical protein